jgi:membrane protease YdiL (CAAX protease family)
MSMARSLRWGWCFLPALLITAAAVRAGTVRGLEMESLLRAAPGVFLLLAAYFTLASSQVRFVLASWIRGDSWRAAVLLQGLSLPYLAYALPLHCFSPSGLLGLLLYLNLPFFLLSLGSTGRPSPTKDSLALLALWLPVELRWLPPLWPWPPGQDGRFLYGILGVPLCLFLFDVLRSLPDIGFTLVPRPRDWKVTGYTLLLFIPLALTFGRATDFLAVHVHVPPPGIALARVLGIFLVTAVPEELLFRGLLQNLIRHWTGRPILALTLAALVFGAAHLNVGSHPDWRLALLATLAGLAYGGAYQASRGLVSAVLVHTFVNVCWLFFLKG